MNLVGESVNEQLDSLGVIDQLLIYTLMKLMGLCAGNKVDLWGLWPGAWVWHSNCGRWSCNWGPKDCLSCVSTFVSGTFVLDTLNCFLFSFSPWWSPLLTLTFSIPPPPRTLFLLVSSALWVIADGRNTRTQLPITLALNVTRRSRLQKKKACCILMPVMQFALPDALECFSECCY